MKSVALVLALLALPLVACSDSGTPSETGNDNAQAARGQTSLWVVTEGAGQGGQAVPFENGSATTVGDVTVEMFIAPYPPAREGSIDLLVTEQVTGAPVEDGAVDVSFDMDMPHGTIQVQTIPSAAGHLLVPYRLVMPGTWQVNVTVSQADHLGSLAFVFKVD